MQKITKIVFLITCFLIYKTTAYSQLEKVMHQTFEVEGATEISLDLVGEYAIEFWAGNNIMTETKVELYDASPAILNHFVEKAKRYSFEMETNETQVVLSSTDKERKAIRTKEKECFEIVKVRVFVPDNFEKLSETSFKRKE